MPHLSPATAPEPEGTVRPADLSVRADIMDLCPCSFGISNLHWPRARYGVICQLVSDMWFYHTALVTIDSPTRLPCEGSLRDIPRCPHLVECFLQTRFQCVVLERTKSAPQLLLEVDEPPSSNTNCFRTRLTILDRHATSASFFKIKKCIFCACNKIKKYIFRACNKPERRL